ncbi:hypothetical protein [Marinomonas gallaica]|uniref:hypothetical protein n=1 Tax=Marinomonas gallaica TaxID=1806667 RepID=UPI00083387C2|nr:hypothetical protein [Marinomonas gallaica]
MKNNTHEFIKIVKQAMKNNEQYFSCLEKIKIENEKELEQKILNDLNIHQEGLNFNLNEILKSHVKDFVLSGEDHLPMSTNVLKDISTQLEVDYLLKNISKEVAYSYYSISHALIYYGIYRGNSISSFENTEFWLKLVKMLYLLNMINTKQYHIFLDGNCPSHPDFNQLKKLIEAKKTLRKNWGK